MRTAFRIENSLLDKVHTDLNRPHPFAAERVGFLACRVATLEDGVSLLAESYLAVEDSDYEDDPRVGAMMGSGAIRKALQHAYNHPVSMIHVHRHEHRGTPQFSRVDLTESGKFIPNFWNVRPEHPHGTLVLSHNAMYGLSWSPQDRRARPMRELSVVGRRLLIFKYDDAKPVF